MPSKIDYDFKGILAQFHIGIKYGLSFVNMVNYTKMINEGYDAFATTKAHQAIGTGRMEVATKWSES